MLIFVYLWYKYLADFKAKFYVNNIVLLLNGRDDLLLLQKPHSNSFDSVHFYLYLTSLGT